jgi:hypothetical protein
MEKHCNNLQYFKEKNYKAKFSIRSILKKKSIEIILGEKITKKNREKNYVRNTVTIHMFCDKSYSASSHDLALFVMTCNYNSQSVQY